MTERDNARIAEIDRHIEALERARKEKLESLVDLCMNGAQPAAEDLNTAVKDTVQISALTAEKAAIKYKYLMAERKAFMAAGWNMVDPLSPPPADHPVLIVYRPNPDLNLQIAHAAWAAQDGYADSGTCWVLQNAGMWAESDRLAGTVYYWQHLPTLPTLD